MLLLGVSIAPDLHHMYGVHVGRELQPRGFPKLYEMIGCKIIELSQIISLWTLSSTIWTQSIELQQQEDRVKCQKRLTFKREHSTDEKLQWFSVSTHLFCGGNTFSKLFLCSLSITTSRLAGRYQSFIPSSYDQLSTPALSLYQLISTLILHPGHQPPVSSHQAKTGATSSSSSHSHSWPKY